MVNGQRASPLAGLFRGIGVTFLAVLVVQRLIYAQEPLRKGLELVGAAVRHNVSPEIDRRSGQFKGLCDLQARSKVLDDIVR